MNFLWTRRKLPTSERQLHNIENRVQCETMSSKHQTLFKTACLKSKRKRKALCDITNTLINPIPSGGVGGLVYMTLPLIFSKSLSDSFR